LLRCTQPAHLPPQEEGFKQFLQRPENRAVLEEHQRKEAWRAEKLADRQQALDFRAKVRPPRRRLPALRASLQVQPRTSGSARVRRRRPWVPAMLTGDRAAQVLETEYSAQRNVAPFLKIPVLRRIVQTFTNDEHDDFGRWADNPLVLQMLGQAKALLDEGRMSEPEMEALLLAQLASPALAAPPGGDAAAARTVRLAAEQLVPALNEHVRPRQRRARCPHRRAWLLSCRLRSLRLDIHLAAAAARPQCSSCVLASSQAVAAN